VKQLTLLRPFREREQARGFAPYGPGSVANRSGV
jgi:hypothetical protein